MSLCDFLKLIAFILFFISLGLILECLVEENKRKWIKTTRKSPVDAGMKCVLCCDRGAIFYQEETMRLCPICCIEEDKEFKEQVKRRIAERAVDQAWELNWENRR